jgi:hypothetical protein
MFDIIKSLNPKQRLVAFLIAAILTSSVAVLTSYLKTDNCQAISDQYNTLIKNQAELMSINNDLIEQNNNKQRDLISVASLLEEMTNTTMMRTEQVIVKPMPVIRPYIMDDSIRVDARVASVTVTQEKTKIIKETYPITYKSTLDSCTSIVNKYK